MNKKNNGITLVALVITIIILLILVGITINSLTGTGLFEKAKLAKEKSENAEKLENTRLEEYGEAVNTYIEGSNRNTGDKVTLIWEGTGNVGDTVTLLNGHQFSEFDSIRFVYSQPSDNCVITEKELLVRTIDNLIENKNLYASLSGFSDYLININNFTENSFDILHQKVYKLDKIYGIKY